MRIYVSPERVQTPIEIKSRTMYKWLYKLRFEYKDVRKDVFIDRYKRPDMVEDCEKFLNTIKDLDPYLVEFEKDRSIKTKNYLDDYAMEEDIYHPVIGITHDEYMFSANNRI